MAAGYATPGQQMLESVTTPLPPRPHFEGQVTFSQMVHPNVWGLNPANYTDITTREVDAADPDKFRRSLLDLPWRSEYAVDGVALSVAEYRGVPHSPEVARYAEPAGDVAAEKYSLTGSIERELKKRDEHRARSLTALLEKTTVFHELAKVEGGVLARAREAAEHPGLRRRTDYDTWDALVAVRYGTFANMLKIVGLRREWTDEKAALASRTLDYRLLMQRGRNAHIGYWRRMLDLAVDYNGAKQELFADRRQRMERHLGIVAAGVELS